MNKQTIRLACKMMTMAVTAMLLPACLSLSSTQTARVLPVGESQVQLGFGALQGSVQATVSTKDSSTPGTATTTTKADSPEIPVAEFGYRHGASESVEFGIKWIPLTTAFVDAKVALVDSPTLSIATGLGIGVVDLEFESDASGSNATPEKLQILDVVLPLYISTELSEYAALYAVPKFMLRAWESNDSEATWMMLGGSAGVRLGKEWGVYIEGAQMQILNDNLPQGVDTYLTQVTASLYFSLGQGPGPTPR